VTSRSFQLCQCPSEYVYPDKCFVTIIGFKLIGTFPTRVRPGQFFLLIRLRLSPDSFRSSA
jgi:hypothetical protein